MNLSRQEANWVGRLCRYWS